MSKHGDREVPRLDALGLRDFLGDAQERNVTRAAERLHLPRQGLTLPLTDLPPAAVLLAWRAGRRDPLGAAVAVAETARSAIARHRGSDRHE